MLLLSEVQLGASRWLICFVLLVPCLLGPTIGLFLLDFQTPRYSIYRRISGTYAIHRGLLVVVSTSSWFLEELTRRRLILCCFEDSRKAFLPMLLLWEGLPCFVQEVKRWGWLRELKRGLEGGGRKRFLIVDVWCWSDSGQKGQWWCGLLFLDGLRWQAL